MSKVDLFAAIRRDSRAGLSVRGLARKYQVSRRTVRSALTSAWPAPRKPMPPRPSKLDAFKPFIDDILRTDLDAPRKQRHTVKRIYDRLIDEHDMHDVSYQVVRAYVADRKPNIRVEAGRGPVNVLFPQTHRPGAEAEVDFGEVAINLRGELVTCMLFAFRLSFSGKAVHPESHPYLVVKQDNNGTTFVISDIEIAGLTGVIDHAAQAIRRPIGRWAHPTSHDIPASLLPDITTTAVTRPDAEPPF